MANIGKLNVIIDGTDKLSKKLQRITGKFKSFAKSVALPISLPSIGILTASLKNYITQAKAIAQVNAGIVSTGNAAGLSIKQLTTEASRLQQASLYGDEQILQKVTAQLLTFTSIKGDIFKETQLAVLNAAAKTEKDLFSFSLAFGKALNDPATGLSALTRYGIKFTDIQKKAVKAYVVQGELGKAQKLILSELTKEFGGAAEAAAKVNPYKKLSNTLGDLLEVFGFHFRNFIHF